MSGRMNRHGMKGKTIEIKKCGSDDRGVREYR